jgi:hypothetical protein
LLIALSLHKKVAFLKETYKEVFGQREHHFILKRIRKINFVCVCVCVCVEREREGMTKQTWLLLIYRNPNERYKRILCNIFASFVI